MNAGKGVADLNFKVSSRFWRFMLDWIRFARVQLKQIFELFKFREFIVCTIYVCLILLPLEKPPKLISFFLWIIWTNKYRVIQKFASFSMFTNPQPMFNSAFPICLKAAKPFSRIGFLQTPLIIHLREYQFCERFVLGCLLLIWGQLGRVYTSCWLVSATEPISYVDFYGSILRWLLSWMFWIFGWCVC